MYRIINSRTIQRRAPKLFLLPTKMFATWYYISKERNTVTLLIPRCATSCPNIDSWIGCVDNIDQAILRHFANKPSGFHWIELVVLLLSGSNSFKNTLEFPQNITCCPSSLWLKILQIRPYVLSESILSFIRLSIHLFKQPLHFDEIQPWPHNLNIDYLFISSTIQTLKCV